MENAIDHAMRHSLDARQQAEVCMESHLRDEWLRVAVMWDELATACREIGQLQEAALIAEFA